MIEIIDEAPRCIMCYSLDVRYTTKFPGDTRRWCEDCGNRGGRSNLRMLNDDDVYDHT